jgi:hypothetical protein
VKLTEDVNIINRNVRARTRTGSIVVAGTTIPIEQEGGCPLCPQ